MAQVGYVRGTATAVVDMIEATLAKQAGWTKVKTTTVTTGLVLSVWKCSTTIKGVAREFHIGLVRQNATNITNVHVYVMEGFNASTDAAVRPVPSATFGGNEVPATDFSVGGGTEYPLYTGTSMNTATFANQVAFTTTTTNVSTIEMYCVVTSDNIYLAERNFSRCVNVGIFESFYADEIMPLHASALVADSAVSRFPTVTAAQSGNWQIRPMAASQAWTTQSGAIAGPGDRLHGNRPVGTRLLLQHSGTPATHGGLRGLTKNTLYFNSTGSSSSGPTIGDTLVINGQTYLLLYFAGSGSTVTNTQPTILVNTDAT